MFSINFIFRFQKPSNQLSPIEPDWNVYRHHNDVSDDDTFEDDDVTPKQKQTMEEPRDNTGKTKRPNLTLNIGGNSRSHSNVNSRAFGVENQGYSNRNGVSRQDSAVERRVRLSYGFLPELNEIVVTPVGTLPPLFPLSPTSPTLSTFKPDTPTSSRSFRSVKGEQDFLDNSSSSVKDMDSTHPVGSTHF